MRAVETISVKLLVGPKLVFVLFIAVVITTESLPTEEEFLDVEPLPVFDDQAGILEPILAVIFVKHAVALIVNHAHLHDALVLKEELLGIARLETGRWVGLHEAHLHAHPVEYSTVLRFHGLPEDFCWQSRLDVSFTLRLYVREDGSICHIGISVKGAHSLLESISLDGHLIDGFFEMAELVKVIVLDDNDFHE